MRSATSCVWRSAKGLPRVPMRMGRRDIKCFIEGFLTPAFGPGKPPFYGLRRMLKRVQFCRRILWLKKTNGAAQTPPGLMQIVVQAQYIKDLSFENPNAPGTLAPGKEPPKLDEVRVDVGAKPMGDDHYEVFLHVKASATLSGKPMFMMELTYAGLFMLKGMPPDALQPLLLIEGPRILFPFARNIVADVTRDGGFTPLMLQPIDFVDLFRQQMARKGEQKSANA